MAYACQFDCTTESYCGNGSQPAINFNFYLEKAGYSNLELGDGIGNYFGAYIVALDLSNRGITSIVPDGLSCFQFTNEIG